MPRFVRRREYLEVQLQISHFRMVQVFHTGHAVLHRVPGPELRKIRAFQGQLTNQGRQFLVIGGFSRHEAQ